VHFVTLRTGRVECAIVGSDQAAPTIVFLHEGLGSVVMWKDFPARIASATGCNALLYSRFGHGNSDRLRSPHRVDFMHEEALTVLPELLDRTGVERPILLGHSTGASIALIHAGGAKREVAGVIAMAPHVMVEDQTLSSIAEAKGAYRTTKLRGRLAKHHPDPDPVFESWTSIWLDPEFRSWNIEAFVARISCPVLAIQGVDDEYGTMAQIDRIAAIARDTELLKLAECGHSPHRDQPEAVQAAIVRFVARVAG
jgi:pimeloyl-ACP methyl ester carboxylesterase